jgi:Toprim domain
MNSYSAAFPTFLSSSEASSGCRWPAMVALVTNVRDGTPIAILPCRHTGDRKSGLGGAIDSGRRSIDLPKDFRVVIVLADDDEGREAAARDCALRCKREGRRVRVARPPQGLDFNNMLQRPAPRNEERAQCFPPKQSERPAITRYGEARSAGTAWKRSANRFSPQTVAEKARPCGQERCQRADIVENSNFCVDHNSRAEESLEAKLLRGFGGVTGLATYDAPTGVTVATTGVDNTMCAQVRFSRCLNFRVYGMARPSFRRRRLAGVFRRRKGYDEYLGSRC